MNRNKQRDDTIKIKFHFKFLSLLQFTDWIEVFFILIFFKDHLNRVYLKDTKDKHKIIAMHSSASYKEMKQNEIKDGFLLPPFFFSKFEL